MAPSTTERRGVYADTFLNLEVSIMCQETVDTMLMFVILLKKLFRLLFLVGARGGAVG